MKHEDLINGLKKEFKHIALQKGFEFKDDDTLESCIEYYIESENNQYESIEDYIDETIENCLEEIFK